MFAINKTIRGLFSSTDLFEVPDYQRPYAWKEKNAKDLFMDISNSALYGEPHHLGTLSFQKKETTSKVIYSVIDGQQRLTTLYLFLLALYTVFEKRNLWNEREKIRFEDTFLLNQDGLPKIQLGSINGDFFSFFVKEILALKNIPTKLQLTENITTLQQINSNKKLVKNFEFFQKNLLNQKEDFLRKLKEFVESNLFTVITLEVDSEILAVKIFETLNDRGLPIDYMDKFKSHLMFLIVREDLSKEFLPFIKDIFGEIFKIFESIKTFGEKYNIDYLKNRISLDDLIIYLYHYSFRYFVKKYGLSNEINYDYTAGKEKVWEHFLKFFELLRQKGKEDLEQVIRELAKDLLTIADSFSQLLIQAESKTEECSLLFKLLVILEPNIRTWHLLVLSQAKDFLEPNLLELIESMDFRIYKVRGTDPRKDLYMEVISRLKEVDTFPLTSFRKFLEAFGNDRDFEYYLLRKDYNDLAIRYILWELNDKKTLKELFAKPNNIFVQETKFNSCNWKLFKKVEVEHIIPQTFEGNLEDFGFQSRDEFNEYLNKMGNLTLITSKLNKECSNKIPKEKVDCYRKLSGELPYTGDFLPGYIERYNFKKEDSDKLTNAMVSFAKQRWKI